MNIDYTRNFVGAGAFWLVIAVAACSNGPEKVSPVLAAAAARACAPFGAVSSFNGVGLVTGYYVQARCSDANDTRVRTRIGSSKANALENDKNTHTQELK